MNNTIKKTEFIDVLNGLFCLEEKGGFQKRVNIEQIHSLTLKEFYDNLASSNISKEKVNLILNLFNINLDLENAEEIEMFLTKNAHTGCNNHFCFNENKILEIMKIIKLVE